MLLALPAWPLGPPLADRVTACVTALERLGYTPLVHFRHGAGEDALVRACDRIRPVGLIAPATDLAPDRIETLRANGTRAVIALSRRPLEHVTTLAFEQRLVGELAIEHLAERGHRHVLALLPTDPSWSTLGRARLAGAESAAARPRRTITATVDLAEGLAAGPTAVYAFNDELALGALPALPEGTALIGTDDSPAARLAHPRLTTIALGTTAGVAGHRATAARADRGRERRHGADHRAPGAGPRRYDLGPVEQFRYDHCSTNPRDHHVPLVGHAVAAVRLPAVARAQRGSRRASRLRARARR